MKKISKLFLIAIIAFAVVGCGKIPTLKNGEEAIVTTKKGSVSANELYEKLKVKSGTAVMVDMIDKIIMDDIFGEKQTDKEKDYVKEQIENLKKSAEQYNTSYSAMISYYGFQTESELKDYFALTYRKNEAVNKYVKKSLSDKEMKNYYNDEIYGDIKVKHILIAPETSDDMTTEQKTAAEKEAKSTAQDIISKLNKGEKWNDLAKQYSTDTATASNGGDLGWISTDEDFVQEFLDAAFKLEKGKYTISPVKTKYGYHIIYKTDEKSKPKYSKVKNEIADALVKQKLEDDVTLSYTTLEKIRKDYDMNIVDTDLTKLYKQYVKNVKSNAKEQAEKNSSDTATAQ